MRWVQVKQDVSKLNVHISVWFMLMTLIYYCITGSEYTIQEITEALRVATKEIGLEVNAEVNAEKSKCVVKSRDQNAVRGHKIKLDNRSFETVEQFKYLGTNLMNQNSIQEGIKSEFRE